MTEDAQISTAPLQTDQQGSHPDLASVVRKHLQTTWCKPVPEHTKRAFDTALTWLARQGNPPLVLDSFCGTGMSTARLAERYPDAAVIGLDKSAHRLAKHEGRGGYLLLRAECEPFWLLLMQAGLNVAQHYMLYPNPWPKASQLKRRVHGHPAFPLLKSLGGTLELRTNWSIFAQEFASASALIGIEGELETYSVTRPWSLFEKKYGERHQELWRFRGNVAARAHLQPALS